jgi:hypothetical protein
MGLTGPHGQACFAQPCGPFVSRMPGKRVRCRPRWNLVMLPHQTRERTTTASGPLIRSLQEWRFPARNRNAVAAKPKPHSSIPVRAVSAAEWCARVVSVWPRAAAATSGSMAMRMRGLEPPRGSWVLGGGWRRVAEPAPLRRIDVLGVDSRRLSSRRLGTEWVRPHSLGVPANVTRRAVGDSVKEGLRNAATRANRLPRSGRARRGT